MNTGCGFDWPLALTVISTAIGTLGFIYGLLRNFKDDINQHIEKLEHRMDRFESRMDAFDLKMISLEERMFLMATGKTLAQAMLEEKMKKSE